jgi:hypothetical protein
MIAIMAMNTCAVGTRPMLAAMYFVCVRLYARAAAGVIYIALPSLRHLG